MCTLLVPVAPDAPWSIVPDSRCVGCSEVRYFGFACLTEGNGLEPKVATPERVMNTFE